MPDLPDAPWATQELPDAPWAVKAAPAKNIVSRMADTMTADPRKTDNYFGLIPMAKGLYHAAKSFASAPGEALQGKLDPSSPEAIGRMTEGAMLMSPLSAASRVGPAVLTKAATPTREAIQQAATQGFEQAKGMGVDIAPAALKEIGTKLERQLQERGILEEHAPTTYATLKRLQEPPAGAVSTISDIHNLRQAFGNAGGNISHPKDTLAGSMGKGLVDEYLSAIPAKDVLAGDAAAASSTLKDAIGNYAAAARSEDVGTRLTRAERQAAKSGSGSNIDNAIRQKISAVLDVAGRTKGWTPAEIAQAEQVVRGTPSANVARKVGKLGVGDGLSLLLHAAAAGASGGATIPLAVAGTVSRKIAEAMTQRQANKLDEMLRSRAPLAQGYSETIPNLGRGARAQEIARLMAAAQPGAQ